MKPTFNDVQHAERDDQIMRKPEQRVLKPGVYVKPRQHALLQKSPAVARYQRRDAYHQNKQNEADNRDAETLLLDEWGVEVSDDSLKQRFHRGSQSLVLKDQFSIS
ncbi:MAG: hypothetical protein AABN34_09525 [Acidobacteriota bacterium]